MFLAAVAAVVAMAPTNALIVLRQRPYGTRGRSDAARQVRRDRAKRLGFWSPMPPGHTAIPVPTPVAPRARRAVAGMVATRGLELATNTHRDNAADLLRTVADKVPAAVGICFSGAVQSANAAKHQSWLEKPRHAGRREAWADCMNETQGEELGIDGAEMKDDQKDTDTHNGDTATSAHVPLRCGRPLRAARRGSAVADGSQRNWWQDCWRSADDPRGVFASFKDELAEGKLAQAALQDEVAELKTNLRLLQRNVDDQQQGATCATVSSLETRVHLLEVKPLPSALYAESAGAQFAGNPSVTDMVNSKVDAGLYRLGSHIAGKVRESETIIARKLDISDVRLDKLEAAMELTSRKLAEVETSLVQTSPVATAGSDVRIDPILSSGCTVTLVGLMNRADLNGRQGVVTSFDAKKQRWAIEVGFNTMLFKAENLCPTNEEIAEPPLRCKERQATTDTDGAAVAVAS